jgi:hypothetical protein
MLLFAFGFLIFALKYNTVYAGTPKSPTSNDTGNITTQNWVVGVDNSIYVVSYTTYNNSELNRYDFKKIWPQPK